MAGERIFVAEDETLIAMVMEDVLAALGYELAGSAHSVAAALDLVSPPAMIDAAILDIELSDDKSWPVADALAQRGIPFAFSTGHGPDAEIDPRFSNAPVLDKPFDNASVDAVLSKLLHKS